MESETYASVWDALADTPAEAANLKARSALLSALTAHVRSWQTTQQDAADRLGITRPRLNDLLRGKLAKFSLDALWNLSVAAGLSVEIHHRVRSCYSGVMDTTPQPYDIFDDMDEEWEEVRTLEAEAEADAGMGVPHDEVVAWVKSWGIANELPRPKSRCIG